MESPEGELCWIVAMQQKILEQILSFALPD
jgi:hypothetical protein